MLLCNCAGQKQALVVKQYQLSDQVGLPEVDPMVRMEKQRHLHGAVSMEERRQRLGQYYSLVWQDSKGVGTDKVKLTFRYQQGATASKIKEIVKYANAEEASGTVEIAVIGDDFSKNGKVLAWKATVERGGCLVAARQSYLWK